MSKEVVKRVKSSDIELKDKLVAVQRVTKVTKGGRHFSFAAIVVVGNEKGVIGQGLGKANEVTDAITKGIEDAKKSLVKVPVLNGTVPHAQEGKFGGALVFLKPAAHGTGVIAGGADMANFGVVLIRVLDELGEIVRQLRGNGRDLAAQHGGALFRNRTKQFVGGIGEGRYSFLHQLGRDASEIEADAFSCRYHVARAVDIFGE